MKNTKTVNREKDLFIVFFLCLKIDGNIEDEHHPKLDMED